MLLILFLFISAAWGSNDFVTPGESSGFDADEGFDSFLAMQAPPEVRFSIKISDFLFYIKNNKMRLNLILG